MITQLLQDSLHKIAPVTRIQLTSININPLSLEARKALEIRNIAQKLSKSDTSPENLRDYRSKRNLANRLIAKERFSNSARFIEMKNPAKICGKL